MDTQRNAAGLSPRFPLMAALPYEEAGLLLEQQTMKIQEMGIEFNAALK